MNSFVLPPPPLANSPVKSPIPNTPVNNVGLYLVHESGREGSLQ